MKRIIMILMAAALVALPTMAQNFKNQNTDDRVQTQAFQSTSTMTPVGSAYSSNPSLNADGTAYNPSSAATPAQSGPRKIGPTVSSDIDEKDKVPVGDAVLPLTLFALAFAMFVYFRRKQTLKG